MTGLFILFYSIKAPSPIGADSFLARTVDPNSFFFEPWQMILTWFLFLTVTRTYRKRYILYLDIFQQEPIICMQTMRCVLCWWWMLNNQRWFFYTWPNNMSVKFCETAENNEIGHSINTACWSVAFYNNVTFQPAILIFMQYHTSILTRKQKCW